MAAALSRIRPLHGALLAAALMLALVAGLALTGAPPGAQNLQRFAPDGIVAAPPAEIRTVEIRLPAQSLALRRDAAGAWTIGGTPAQPVPAELAAHVETALRFLQVAAPTRRLAPEEYREARFADFGLDPPAYVVSLTEAGGATATVDFGTLTPAQTGQYVRLLGRPALYLMPRHVGAEWRLAADLAARVAPPGTGGRSGLLLPASIDQVWAVEIVAGGKLHRFERDGAGSWFLHVGQHTHAPGSAAHVADPARAPVIAAALGSFDDTQIEALAARQPDDAALARFGLDLPSLIVLLYPRDSSTALARLEIGAPAGDGFSRYARLAGGGEIVTIAGYEAQRLIDLLKAVGAAP